MYVVFPELQTFEETVHKANDAVGVHLHCICLDTNGESKSYIKLLFNDNVTHSEQGGKEQNVSCESNIFECSLTELDDTI